MKHHHRLYFGIALLCLSACRSLHGTGSPPPLPALETIKCCWQSEERVVLTLDEKVIALQAIVLREANQLTVVMLDSFGHRQLTLVHQQSGTRVLTAPENWDNQFSHYLLLGIFLHQSDETWLGELSPWQTHRDDVTARKYLSFKGKVWMTINYEPESGDVPFQPRLIEFKQLPLSLHVTTLSRTAL